MCFLKSTFIIYIYNSEQFNVFWIKSKTNWVQNHSEWFFIFLIILSTCLRYAFKEIILAQLHPFQKLLRGRSNFVQPENEELLINFHKIK